MEEGGNITGHLISTTYKVSPISPGGLEVPLLLIFSVKSDYTGQLVENNEEESGDNEEIYIKLIGEENVTNKNNENVIEID